MPRLTSFSQSAFAGLGITRGPGFFELLYTLTNPNTGGGTSTADAYGDVVAISNDWIVVSAPAESTNSGYVYVYNMSDGSLQYSLSNPNSETTSTNDQFGRGNIALNGNNLIVGARAEYVSTSPQSGVAYIYDLTDGSLTYTLTNPNSYSTGDYDQFGSSVAIDSTYAIVGAPLEDAFQNNDSGFTYVFTLSNGVHTGSIGNPNTTFTKALDSFGGSVATNGTLFAIAADGEDNPTNAAGVIHVYNTSQALQRTIANPRSDSLRLGQYNKMDIDGNNLIAASSTYVHVFDITDGSEQRQLGQFSAPVTAVSIAGDYALIASSNNSTIYDVYLYNWTTGELLETVSPIDPVNFNSIHVSIHGTKLVIGDGANNTAYVYQLNT